MLNSFSRRAARVASAAVVWLAFCPGLRAAGVEFTRLAPAKPTVILTIPDFSRMRASFDASELGKLWQEPGVQAFVEELTSDASKQMAEFFKELGAESKEFKPPTGPVGFAVYLPEAPKGERPGNAPATFFAADVGENAKSWKDLIEKLVDKGVADKQLTVDEDTYAGVTIQILKPIYQDQPAPEPAKPAGGADDEDQGPLDAPQTGFAAFAGGSKEHPQAYHIAWSGDTLLGASRLVGLEHAIDAMQGKDTDSAASDPDFKAAVAQHPADTQAAIYVDVGQIVSKSLGEALAGRSMPQQGGPDFGKLMSAIGVAQIKFVGLGLRMGTAEGVTDISMGILAPEKRGILDLMREPLGAFDPPGFVTPDAASITRFSFRFDKVYDLLREVAAVLPEEEGKQFSAGLDQGVNLVKPGLDSLGPAVDMVGTLRLPLAQDSQMTLFAIEVKDQETVSNTLAFFASQAQGMAESREFEGNTVYTVELAKMSVGLGFHRLFIGPTPAVENAMRLAGRTDAPRMSGEESFKAATRGFSSDGVMQSFSDTSQALRWSYWTLQNAENIAEAQIDAAGLEPDQKEEILKRVREQRPKWLEKLPPLESLLRHIGNSASEMHPTPDGFRGRTLMLRPAPN